MYKSNFNKVLKFNNEFAKYLDQEFSGTDLATIINLAIDNNEKYKIAKDVTGTYQEDDLYSIRIDVYMTDTEKTYSMETLSAGEISNLVNNYSNIQFKCTNVKYHKKSKRVSYLYIEQIA
jgi:hypothetical protein